MNHSPSGCSSRQKYLQYTQNKTRKQGKRFKCQIEIEIEGVCWMNCK